jgi:hypothetical protein
MRNDYDDGGVEPWQKMMFKETRSTGMDYSWYMDMMADAKADHSEADDE